MKDKASNYNRRRILQITAATTASIGAVGVAAGSEHGRRDTTPEDYDVVGKSERENHQIVVVESAERVAGVKIFTEGEKEGVVEHTVISDRITASTERDGLTEIAANVDGYSAVIEKRKSISRKIGSCGLNYCKTDNWPHYQEGTAIKLSKPADVIGKATLTEVIGGLVAVTKSAILGGVVGVIVATMLTLGTGRNYTITEYDRDGWVFPRVSAGVANSWDANPGQHQTVIQSRARHVYECHEDLP
ncbi:hypothetical protein NP511_11130 [Natrinema thermotolerans]|uniref:Uncharacterized protein n=1 Tax=Natrinema thermotolerans TaxID=121872 RepID=A0AAF0SXD7_9EURY|nr:hypothetical protein [Natrinema thermotolerans]WMT05941.1 hypothetical protein NP511_11130 [Natrinema thermotolerans]